MSPAEDFFVIQIVKFGFITRKNTNKKRFLSNLKLPKK